MLLGVDLHTIKSILLDKGFSEYSVDKEMVVVQTHPYVAAAMELQKTLQKREALLKTIDYYQHYSPSYLYNGFVPLPSYEDFIRDYLACNHIGFFKNAIDHWPAMQWSPQSFLDKVGAQTLVEVQKGRSADDEYEFNNNQLRQSMRFGDFIEHMETAYSNDIYLTANNLAADTSCFSFIHNDIGPLGDGYLSAEAHNMYLWMGPAGTVTSMHHDRTQNLFFQIYGRKRFLLYPATQTPYMYNRSAVYSPINPIFPDLDTYPLFAKAKGIDITPEPGDMVYIPIGWWHYVVSETASISLSTTRLSNVNNVFVDYPL